MPCPESTCSTEPYNLDHTTAYLQNPNAIMGMYGANFQWNQASQRIPLNRPSTYLEDQNSQASYTLAGLPVLQTSNLPPNTTAEAMSPLNMTSIQSALPLSLPMRPHNQAAAPRRQLPIPQPSPARRARNAVDILQDQRLRSVQTIPGIQMHSFARPALTWSSDSSGSDAQSTPSSEASSNNIVAHSATTRDINDTIAYSGITASTKRESVSSNTQQQLSFSTSPLLETMPTVAGTTTYSNFRNYTLPTSSSTDTLAVLARPNSLSNMYSFSTDSSEKQTPLRRSSNEGALISGQQYTPLQPSPDGTHLVELKSQPPSINPSSMPTLNRSF
ncbi:uncharacterized protein EI97DRAFT_461074 [Westerdykella ornata]|uniref:Uncharacterized protein n=1 Tax=Westerdykella ornata TaxID=318751 RepID=A0A6A6J9Y8_WESOR|nr:uncharacterized protein EI97DRAFT_461074 [Westerdykella ornata]KAF2273410.1 hypothetical protein EI97DRAFT_461074 [Westerdykella ornata]